MQKIQKLWELRDHSAARYIMAGLCAFTAQYAFINLGYYGLTLSIHISTSVGYIAGLSVSYAFNRHWVFGKDGKHKHIARQAAEYTVLVIFNYFFTVLSIAFLKNHGIPPYISPVLVTGVIICWNYLLYRHVIFKGKNDIEPITR